MTTRAMQADRAGLTPTFRVAIAIPHGHNTAQRIWGEDLGPDIRAQIFNGCHRDTDGKKIVKNRRKSLHGNNLAEWWNGRHTGLKIL